MEREWNAAHLNASVITCIDEGALGYAQSLPYTFAVPLFLGSIRVRATSDLLTVAMDSFPCCSYDAFLGAHTIGELHDETLYCDGHTTGILCPGFWCGPNGYFIADGACTCRERSTQFRIDRVQQFIQAGDDCLL